MGRPRTYSTRNIEAARKKARKGGWVLKKQPGTAYIAARAKKAASPTRTTTRRSTTRRSTTRTNPDVVSRSGTMRTPQARAFYEASDFRKFNGKRFRKWTATFDENEAKREAARIRGAFSANARVVKKRIGRKNAYVVYRSDSRPV